MSDKKFDLEKAKQLRATGLSYAKIGKELGYSGAYVMIKLKEAEQPVTIEQPPEVKPEVKPEPIKSTKPWEDKPWVPDRFRLKKKHQGFTPRFVAKENLEKRTDEGFIIADMNDYGYDPKNPETGQGQVDTTLRRHGMILMEMPDELMERKRAYIKHKTDNQDTDVLKKKLMSDGHKISRELGSSRNLLTEE